MPPRRIVRTTFGVLLSSVIAVGLLRSAKGEVSGTPASTNEPALRDYLTGNGLLNRGLHELAIAEYRKFLSQYPQHAKAPLAKYGLAVALFRLNRFEEALAELESMQTPPDFPYAAEVCTIAGQCQLALKRPDAAVESFAKVLTRFAEHELADDAAAGAVEALYLAGHHEEAVSRGRSFASQWPQDPLGERVVYFAGLSEVARHDYGAAAEQFQQLVENYPGGPFAEHSSLLLAQCLQKDDAVEPAIEQYRRVVAGGGLFLADALAGLGALLYQRGDRDEAGQTLDRLISDFAESPHVSPARLQRGRLYFDEGQFGRALTEFGHLASSEFADAAAFWAAKCELRVDQPSAAAKRLADALSRFPESNLRAEMTYDRAIALLRCDDLNGAIVGLEDFRAHFADHALAPDALRLLATTEHRREGYERSNAHCTRFQSEYPEHESASEMTFLAAENDFLLGQMDRAAAAFGDFLKKYPSASQFTKAKFRLGLCLYRLERFDEAAIALETLAANAKREQAFRPALLALGDIYFQRGEWKRAEGHFAEYLEADTTVDSADDALFKLALSRQRQERYEDSLGLYARLVDQFPQSPHRAQALFERGQCFTALKRFDEAVAAFERVLTEGGSNPFAAHALSQLAAIAASRGESEKAAGLFAQLAERAGDDGGRADALFQRAQALMADSKLADAESAYRLYVERFPTGTHVPEARLRSAIAIARQDRCADALAAMEVAAHEGVGKLSSSLRAALSYEKGWCLRALGRNDDAAAAFRAVLKEPSAGSYDLHAMLELGQLESEAGQFAAAVEILGRLRDTMAARPAEADSSLGEQSFYRLALAHFELRQFEPAASLFEEFLGARPKSPLVAAAGFYAGEASFKLNRHEKAIAHFTRIVKEYKDDAVFAPTLLRLGECLSVLQRWAPSEQTFATYLDRFADSEAAYQARFGLAWARENQKRFDEAIAAYAQVVTNHQGQTAARAQFQIGQCLFAQQKYDDAVRELLKVDILYAYPEWSAAALYEAGRCFEKLNKPAEAQRQFGQVTEKYKDTNWAQLATKKLNELSTAAAPPGRS